MKCSVIAVSIVLSAMSFVFGEDDEDASITPEWIWPTGERNGRQTSHIWREFSVENTVTEARLRLAADFCHADVTINRKSVAELDAYGPWLDIDVTDFVRRGKNRLDIRSRGVTGPSAIAASLTLTFADGKTLALKSGPKWQSEGKLKSYINVAPELWNSSIGTDAFDDYTQWKQASGGAVKPDPATFATQPGFTIEHIRTAKEGEDSWVSMAFDPKGRLTIAREKRGLLRFTFKPLTKTPEVIKVETVNDTLQECRGLLYAFGSLYANANNSKGLYRLRDTTKDGQFDEVKLLREFPGRVGHGRNDLALGPDGKIYSIHGDAVDIPKTAIQDHTSPFREARQGQTTTEGVVIRTDENGKRWEIIAAGLRNPYGIDFNVEGDLFTYDADAEHDMGAPWYRPTRINHLVSGADFGWRGRTGQWPPWYPDHADNALPVLDIGKGSPTALHSGQGTNFPIRYQQAMFVLDWTYGRIFACHQTPRGAGWIWRPETFLKGRPLNVTDIDVGPDGALYIITGGRGTESSLYRIRYTGGATASMRILTLQQAAREKFSKEQRFLRRNLEAYHGVSTSSPVRTIDFVWPHLGSPDPVLRHAARVTVETQRLVHWQQKALDETDPHIAVTALLALARSPNRELDSDILQRLSRLPFGELSAWETLAAAQAMSLCLTQLDSLPEKTLTSTRDTVADWLAKSIDSTAIPATGAGGSVQRELSRLAVQLNVPDVVEPVVLLMLQAKGQADRMHFLFLLRNQKAGWSEGTRRSWFETLQSLERDSLGGAGMPDFLRQIRQEATATLTDDERQQLTELLKPGNQVSESELTIARPFVREWTMDDLDELLAVPAKGPDRENGRRLFQAALCSRCHRLGQRGGLVGPDLTSVAGRFSQRDILTSILDPSRVIAGKYRNTQIVTDGGKTIVGRVLTGGDYRSPKLRISTDPLRPSKIEEVEKSDIDIRQDSKLSPMPKGLLNTLSKREILDLLAAIRTPLAE